MTDILQPKKPVSRGWLKASSFSEWHSAGFTGEAWLHMGRRIRVIAALVRAGGQYGTKRRFRYHLSMSRQGKRCTGAEVSWTLAQFGMAGAVEDLRDPGARVRQFWIPVTMERTSLVPVTPQKWRGRGTAEIDRSH